MILHVSPHAPVLVSAAAATLLFLHIGGASAGLVSGPVAMLAAKGGRLHRAAGNVFFGGILLMSGIGATVAPFLPRDQVPNTMAGLFTFYLVSTAWATVRRREGEIGRFEVGAVLLALGAAAMGIGFGWASAHGAHPLPAPEGPVLYLFATFAILAATCDVSMIARGGLYGAARIARHLWRMSLALLITVGSFAGQPKAIPPFLRGSPLLVLPMIAVLAGLVYWLVRVRFARGVKVGVAA